MWAIPVRKYLWVNFRDRNMPIPVFSGTPFIVEAHTQIIIGDKYAYTSKN
jgi:hypothetical protein